MNLIPGCSVGVREKILAMPSVGVGGKAHVCRNKCADLASCKKTTERSRFQLLCERFNLSKIQMVLSNLGLKMLEKIKPQATRDT